MSTQPKSSRIGTAIRFACGFLVGVLMGFWAVSLTAVNDVALFALALVFAGTVAGALAVRFGGRFWEAFGHLRWFVP